MNEHRRASDDIEIAGTKIPKRWKRFFMVIGAIGTFAGSFWIAINQNEKRKRIEDIVMRTATDDQYPIKIERISKTVEEIQDSIGSLVGQNEDLRVQVRDLKRQVQAASRGRDCCSEERADERHAEVIGRLEELEKKGIKRR